MIAGWMVWTLLAASVVAASELSQWFLLATAGSLLLAGRSYLGGWIWEPTPHRVPLPIQKLASPNARMLAGLVDVVVMTGFACAMEKLFPIPDAVAWTTIQPMWVVAGVSVRDFLGSGRSIGKRLLQLAIVDASTGALCSWRQQGLRNVPYLGAAMVCAVVSLTKLEGLQVVAFVLAIYVWTETVSQQARNFRSRGDKLANTAVVNIHDPQGGFGP